MSNNIKCNSLDCQGLTERDQNNSIKCNSLDCEAPTTHTEAIESLRIETLREDIKTPVNENIEVIDNPIMYQPVIRTGGYNLALYSTLFLLLLFVIGFVMSLTKF